MFWIILAVIVLMIFSTVAGRAVIGIGVAAIGLLLLDWIFDVSVFITLAKIGAGAIVVIVVLAIIGALID